MCIYFFLLGICCRIGSLEAESEKESSGNVLGSTVRISTYKERDGHASRQWEKLCGSIVTAKFQSSPWAALQLGWPFRVSSYGREGTGSLYCIVCVCVCVCVCVSCLLLLLLLLSRFSRVQLCATTP